MSDTNDVDQVDDQVESLDETTPEDTVAEPVEDAGDETTRDETDEDETDEDEAALGSDDVTASGSDEDADEDADGETSEENDPLEAFRRELWAKPGDWFVVHTYSGMEKRVKHNLENRIISLNMEDYIHE
ncbi:MAG TPA: transcription termination/antitermination protein NusG, partial [Nocardioides sp.]|nr:transcription termination/antitermination protein NusG [Nocardioides sp.]